MYGQATAYVPSTASRIPRIRWSCYMTPLRDTLNNFVMGHLLMLYNFFLTIQIVHILVLIHKIDKAIVLNCLRSQTRPSSRPPKRRQSEKWQEPVGLPCQFSPGLEVIGNGQRPTSSTTLAENKGAPLASHRAKMAFLSARFSRRILMARWSEEIFRCD